MNERERRIARARLLRREGKTYDEIRAVIGPIDDETLRRWCKGIPRPPATYRSHPQLEMRKRCRVLRAQGLTYDEIAALTGVSTSSMSLWLRDVTVASSRVRPYATRARAGVVRARGTRAAAAAHTGPPSDSGRRLGAMGDRELLAAGVALYWAEGSKAKPWRPGDRQVVFINSDPTVLVVFLAWLDLLGVPETSRTYRLSIHETADVASHEEWWARELHLDRAAFHRASLKRHRPTTVRKNVNEGYHGCLVVRVARPAAVYDAIEGWWHRVVSASTQVREQSVGSRLNGPGWSKGMTRPFGGPRWGFESSPGS